MAKTTKGATVIKTEMLDRKMNDVFDWADDELKKFCEDNLKK